jgi:UDP-GlcNAc:undecaprenyl-phosphate GlcNAc-1-phosphate transferase
MKTYLFVYLGSTFVSLAFTPLTIWIAHRLSIVDVPGQRHMHVKPIARIGGVAIWLSMLSLTLPVLFLSNMIGDAFRDLLSEVVVMLCAAGLIFFVGLIDDIKTSGLRASTKLLAQIAAALAVCAVGIRIQSVTITDKLTLEFGRLSWPLTLLWIVGITNAVNLSDGLDGLAAGISAVACAVIAVFAFYSSNVVMVVLMLALFGSLTGFLFFNFNPAKIFMGDCGSMFLGFIIASSGVLCSIKSPVLVGLALPFLALGIPIFDTLFTILRRFLERRSIFAADRRHFHHRLIDLGLKQRHVTMTAYMVTLLVTGLGMTMIVTRDGRSLIVFTCLLFLLLMVFRVVGCVRLKEVIEGLKRKYAISHREHEERRNFENALLYFRRVKTSGQWWQAVCAAAERMNFAWVSLKTANKDGSTDTSLWRTSGALPDMSKIVTMNVRLADRRTDTRCELEIAIGVNDSFESASHRAMLFNRLIDEHNVVDLVSTTPDRDGREADVIKYTDVESSMSASMAGK